MHCFPNILANVRWCMPTSDSKHTNHDAADHLEKLRLADQCKQRSQHQNIQRNRSIRSVAKPSG